MDKLIYLFSFFLLVFSPIPIGSVEPWARFILQIQAFLVFALWALQTIRKEREFKLGGKSQLLIFMFLALCLLQIIPLPGFLLRILSAKSLEIWKENQAVLSSIGYKIESSFFTISLYPHATWEKTLEFLSYFAFGFVVSRTFTKDSSIKALLIPAVSLAFFEATYGLYQYVGKGALASGTFVNHNHFAGLLEMCIPLSLGYALSLGEERDEKERRFFRKLASSETLQKQLLLLFLFSLMLLSLLLSGSRMGIFSSLFALIFFYLSYRGFKRERAGSGVVLSEAKEPEGGFGTAEKGWMILFVFAIAVFYGLWIGLYPVFERFLRIEGDAPVRTLVWRDMLGIIKDFPIFGSGLGTFSYIYPLYKHHMEAPLRYTYAHNDWLQLITETGMVGFLLITAGLILFLFSSFRNLTLFSKKRDNLRFFLGIGALSGIVSILIHSLADFNLHIPSNALYFAFLIGLMGALMRSSRV